MFWVKDIEGNLVNLARVREIYCSPASPQPNGTYELRVSTFGPCLYRGTREECGKFRDKLFLELTANQRGVHVID